MGGKGKGAFDQFGFPRYTPEEYEIYRRAPQWVLDNCASEAEYQNKLCAKVKSWYQQSKDEYRNEKEIWQICYQRLKDSQKAGIRSQSILEDAVAAAMIPIMRNSMLEQIASLYSGQYAPIYKALAPKAQPMISMANRYLQIELKQNKWDTLKFNLGQDGWVADIWIMKLLTDSSDPGPFGEDERIVIQRVDPLSCYPDPKAARWHWPDMDYFIVEESLDIGVARNRFRDKAALIDKNLAQPDNDKERWGQSQLLVLQGQKKEWKAGVERTQIKIKECWMHCDLLVFRGYEETITERNVDPETGEIRTTSRTEWETDDEGYVKGQWERKYPHGRLVVTANDSVVLLDIGNPYWHNGLPFIFCPMSPDAGRLFNVGKAAPVLGIERKKNDIETRVHAYAQSEIERPMMADHGALPTNAQWFSLGNQSRRMIIVNKGFGIVRPPPVETPTFIQPYLMRLDAYKDQTTGQGGLLQGNLAEGSQLSAQAMQMMQGAQQGRLNMESVFIAIAMMEFGYKMLCLQRQTYKADMQAEVYTPMGKPIQVAWNQKEIGADFFVDIDLAANQPGGQQLILNQAIQLKRESLVDRPYVLSIAGIEGWETIDQRMNEQKLNEITAQAFARTYGINVKKAEAADRGPTEKPK